jgi:hypothetical protein
MSADFKKRLQQIRDLAAKASTRKLDALTAAREIDSHATAIGLGLEEPFIVLKGITSQADDLPDPEQLRFMDSATAAERLEQRTEFLRQFGTQILDVCREIQRMVDDRTLS